MELPNFEEFNEALTQLGEAMSKAFTPLIEAFGQLAEQLPPEFYHKMGSMHPRERLNHYYRDEAEPAEVVQYILQQPDHTWMGVTIYPDEAWRYACKFDWMWWRE